MFRNKLTRFVILAISALFSASVLGANITGAGATFPYPIYAKWADAYKKSTGVGMNYQSIGSGGGIKQITAKTVDFGASDMPMTPEDLEKNGLIQFPVIMGGVVPVFNLKSVRTGELRFSGEVLANIYLGKIKKWNDPAIQAINKKVNLPDAAITVVHRSDGSGTTFIFANYLSKVSPEWKSAVGEGTSVTWPAGVGGKGNEGVANYVSRIDGAIGYVEYAYAMQNGLSVALLLNKAKEFAAPSEEAFKAAAASADWSKAPGMYLILTDQSGAESWPMTGASFILMHRIQDKPENAKEVLKFFDWAFQNGSKMAADLNYVPMPPSVMDLIRLDWKNKLKSSSGQSIY